MNKDKKYHTYTKFGITLYVEVITVSGGKVDKIPNVRWDCEMWIEKGEDWYVFHRKELKNKVVRVVTPEMWQTAVYDKLLFLQEKTPRK